MNTSARLGVFAAAPLLALSLVTPAHAGGYTYYDKAGDVAVETCDADYADCTYPIDATIREGDAIRSTVLHHAHNVELRATYRELSAAGRFHAEVQTNEQVIRNIALTYEPGRGVEVSVSRPGGRLVTCNLSVTVSYARNIIDVKLPRRCLSRPRWVRVGLWHETGTRGSAAGAQIDDGQAYGLGRYLTFGPKVFRG